MKLLFVCVAVVLLASEGLLVPREAKQKLKRKSVAEAFKNADITPDIIPEAPMKILGVEYDEAVINLGNYVYPADTIGLPELEYDFEPGCYYTFIVIDPDVPSAETPFWRSYLMGLYVNVQDGNLEDADEVATLLPASPIPGTGEHRIIYLLFKQSGPIDCKLQELANYQVDRLAFDVVEFAEEYLCELVAANFMVTQFPDNIESYCKKLGKYR